jgi:hypothetical protein
MSSWISARDAHVCGGFQQRTTGPSPSKSEPNAQLRAGGDCLAFVEAHSGSFVVEALRPALLGGVAERPASTQGKSWLRPARGQPALWIPLRRDMTPPKPDTSAPKQLLVLLWIECPVKAVLRERCSFLRPTAASSRNLARRHQVANVLLEELVMVVQLVVLLLDRLDLVEERSEGLLEGLSLPG